MPIVWSKWDTTKTTFLHCDLWTLLDTWRLWFYGLFSVHLILYCQTLSVVSYLGDFTHRSGNYWATDVDNQKDFQQRVLLLIKQDKNTSSWEIVNLKRDSGKIPKYVSFYFICLLICWHCIIDESSKKSLLLLFEADEIAHLLFILWVTNIDKLVFLTSKIGSMTCDRWFWTTDFTPGRSRHWVSNNYTSQMIHAK